MSPTRTLARPMLASIYIVGGLSSLKTPGPRVEIVKQSAIPDLVPGAAPDALSDPATLVRINSISHVVGGVALATGKFPRLAALGLAATLVPTTVAGHPFWKEKDKAARGTQQVHFFKNLSMLGGLLIASADTGGRESVPHAAGRLSRKAKKDARKARKNALVALHHTDTLTDHLSEAFVASVAAGKVAQKKSRKQLKELDKKTAKPRAKALKAASQAAADANKAATKSAKKAQKKAKPFVDLAVDKAAVQAGKAKELVTS